MPEAITTPWLGVWLGASRGPSLIKGQRLVPALGVRQRRVAQGNSASMPLQRIFTSRTADTVHAGRWYPAQPVKAANTPRRGTARPPGSVGGRRSGQGRTRAPAEHRHRASGIARRRGTHPSPDRRTSPEKEARRQSCAPLPRQPPNQQHGKDDQQPSPPRHGSRMLARTRRHQRPLTTTMLRQRKLRAARPRGGAGRDRGHRRGTQSRRRMRSHDQGDPAGRDLHRPRASWTTRHRRSPSTVPGVFSRAARRRSTPPRPRRDLRSRLDRPSLDQSDATTPQHAHPDRPALTEPDDPHIG